MTIRPSAPAEIRPARLDEDADPALMKRLAAGDRHAFEAIYNRYGTRLGGYVARLVKRRDLIDEVMNDVMLAVWKEAGRFDTRRPLQPWLFGITHLKALKRGKQRRRLRIRSLPRQPARTNPWISSATIGIGSLQGVGPSPRIPAARAAYRGRADVLGGAGLRGDRDGGRLPGEHGQDPDVPCPPAPSRGLGPAGNTGRRRRLRGSPMSSEIVHPGDHEEAWDLLPWYVNGTLAEDEERRVKAHIEICAECREELVRCQALSRAVRMQPRSGWTSSREHLAGVLERIDREEAQRGRAHTLPKSGADKLRALSLVFAQTPRALRWAFAVQALVVVALAAALVTEAGHYTTLSSPQERPRADGRRVQIVFAPEMTEREIRTLLQGVGATIAEGPSPAGVYTLVLSATPAESAIEDLRKHPKVRLAEPKSGR